MAIEYFRSGPTLSKTAKYMVKNESIHFFKFL